MATFRWCVMLRLVIAFFIVFFVKVLSRIVRAPSGGGIVSACFRSILAKTTSIVYGPSSPRIAVQILWLCVHDCVAKRKASSPAKVAKMLRGLTTQMWHSLPAVPVPPLLPSTAHALFANLAAERGGIDFFFSFVYPFTEYHLPCMYGKDMSTEHLTLVDWLYIVLRYSINDHIPDAVAALAETGVDIHMRDTKGWNLLFLAASMNEISVAEALIAAGFDVNATDVSRATPLNVALGSQHVSMVQLLLDAKADVNTQGKQGTGTGIQSPSPFLFAATLCDARIVRMLLAANPDLEFADYRQGYTPLMSAAIRHNAEVARVLVDAGAVVDARSKHGSTALILASITPHTDVLRVLIDARADVNHVDEDGCTALFHAVQRKHIAHVRMLVDARADVNITTKKNDTALAQALQQAQEACMHILLDAGADTLAPQIAGLVTKLEKQREVAMVKTLKSARETARAKIAELQPQLLLAVRDGAPAHVLRDLLAHRVDVECVDKHGNTPLLLAVQRGNEVAAAMLLDAKARVDVVNTRGVSPLMAAVSDVRGNGGALVERLVNAKADVNARDRLGKTPLMVAAYHGRQAVLAQLLAAKVRVNVCDMHGTTPLQLAARSGSVRVLQSLLSAKADVKARDKQGNTSLLLSVRSGSVECVRMLLDAKADICVKNKAREGVLHVAVGENMRALLRERDKSQL